MQHLGNIMCSPLPVLLSDLGLHCTSDMQCGKCPQSLLLKALNSNVCSFIDILDAIYLCSSHRLLLWHINNPWPQFFCLMVSLRSAAGDYIAVTPPSSWSWVGHWSHTKAANLASELLAASSGNAGYWVIEFAIFTQQLTLIWKWWGR